MNRHLRFAIAVLAAWALFGVSGCGGNAQPPAEPTPPASSQQPAAPTSLFDEITAASYTQWTPAPGFESRQPAKGPHGDEVQVFLDPSAEKALAAGGTEWPVGAIIVKDIYTGGALTQTAAMKKTDKGWYWGEWGPQGPVVGEGLAVEPCESCHAKGTDGTLSVELK
jgi:hypothetical protein